MARDARASATAREFTRYKEDVKKRGEAASSRTRCSTTRSCRSSSSCVIIALACDLVLRPRTAPKPGILGPWYTEQADPGRPASSRARTGTSTSSSTSCGSSSGRRRSFLGTVGIPTILLILLIALPFYDRRRERRLAAPAGRDRRRGPRRSISMGVLTWKGATAKEALGSELIAASSDEWAEAQGFADNEAAVAGATLFAQSGCLNCHTYLGEGNGEPRRTGPLATSGASDEAPTSSSPYVVEPGAVREQRDELVRVPRRGEPHAARRRSSPPRRAQRSVPTAAGSERASRARARARYAPACRSSSASPARRARRTRQRLLRRARRPSGCEVGLCASRAGDRGARDRALRRRRRSRARRCSRGSSAARPAR